MVIEDIKNRVIKMLDVLDIQIKETAKEYQQSNQSITNRLCRQVYGGLLVNKAFLEDVLDTLNPDNNNYRSFTTIEPILDNNYPNKEDRLTVYGFLLAKAKRSETDYTIAETYIDGVYDNKSVQKKFDDCLETSNLKEFPKDSNFLVEIVSDDGQFLPHILSNYDRVLLRALGVNDSQIILISKYCRSLYKKQKNEVKPKEEISGKAIVDIKQITKNIKQKQEQLNYLKRFISLDNWKIVYNESIFKEDELNIIAILKHLNFSFDKIELIQRRIIKHNDIIHQNNLLIQVEELKKDLFTNEMFGIYDDALNTVNNKNVIYSNIKEQIKSQLNYIDIILINCINGLENKDNTCEYLVMAFEDLGLSLNKCGARLVRTL